MSSETKHTTTPWFPLPGHPPDGGLYGNMYGRRGDTELAAVPRGSTPETFAANAAFIVRAVNAHEDLMAAAEAGARYSDALQNLQQSGLMGTVAEGSEELDCLFKDWHDKTHAVLAKAQKP